MSAAIKWPSRLKAGEQAESEACRFLIKQGLTLIERNFRSFQGEIDLIMQDRNTCVFVEVRLRNRIDYGNAIESVNLRKQRKIIKTATHYLQQKKWLYKVKCRFDIVAFHPVNHEFQLEWMKNAFWE